MAVTKRNVRFYARGLQVAGILNIPVGAEERNKMQRLFVCIQVVAVKIKRQDYMQRS